MCLNKNCSKMHQDFFVRSRTIIIFVEKHNLFCPIPHSFNSLRNRWIYYLIRVYLFIFFFRFTLWEIFEFCIWSEVLFSSEFFFLSSEFFFSFQASFLYLYLFVLYFYLFRHISVITLNCGNCGNSFGVYLKWQ